MVPPDKCYVTAPESLTSDFGLQDLTGLGKSLIILHDLGENISSTFVDLIRRLVSSGEGQNTQRKYSSSALLLFEGLFAAASNRNARARRARGRGLLTDE